MKIFKRTIIYILGLLSMAIGISFSKISGLGLSPINSFPNILSKITKVSFGTMIILVYSFFILMQIVILRKEYKPINLLQFLFAIIFGKFVDFTYFLLNMLPQSDSYFIKLLLIALCVIFCGLGLFLYIEADIMVLPAEGFASAIMQKTNKPFSKIKVTLDVSVVIMTIITSLIFYHSIVGVREGTVISSLLIGTMSGVFKKLLQKPLDKFIDKQ